MLFVRRGSPPFVEVRCQRQMGFPTLGCAHCIFAPAHNLTTLFQALSILQHFVQIVPMHNIHNRYRSFGNVVHSAVNRKPFLTLTPLTLGGMLACMFHPLSRCNTPDASIWNLDECAMP